MPRTKMNILDRNYMMFYKEMSTNCAKSMNKYKRKRKKQHNNGIII